ncbi:MAG: hypothetical protein WC867_06870 [Candidatus Pacearchaeota archaeon]|jgi:hypothetical protein
MSDSTYISPGLFIILGIVSVGIVLSVIMFFSNIADVRIEESKSLLDRVVDTISDNGYLKSEIFEENYSLIENAKLNNNLFADGFIYLSLEIYKMNSKIKEIDVGDSDYKIQCRLKGKHYPRCYYKEFILADKNNPLEIYKIKILTGSNNLGSSV